MENPSGDFLLFDNPQMEITFKDGVEEKRFVVRGLSSYERDQILDASKQIVGTLRQKDARLEVSLTKLHILKLEKGIVEAPWEVKKSILMKLRRPIREELLRTIEELSELSEDEEKK